MMETVVGFFMENGYLLSPDTGGLFDNVDKQRFLNKIKGRVKHRPLVINKDLYFVLSNLDNLLDINWNEFEKALVDCEKGRDSSIYNSFLDMVMYNLSDERRKILNKILEGVKSPEELDLIDENGIFEPNVLVLKSYDTEAKKRVVSDFVDYFKNRYDVLKRILLSRPELQDSISISRLKGKKQGEVVKVIGVVYNKEYTKNGNLILTLEDGTGIIKLLVIKGRGIYNLADEANLDEVIGVSGVCNSDVVYCNDIFFPDIPNNHNLRCCDDDAYMVIASDTHFGIKNFLDKGFNRFLNWLNGGYGSDEQKEIASKIRYLFIVGDLVEGVGVYPDQEKDLVIRDIYKQYELAYDYLSKVPGDINIIICGGNHDAMRLSEPQPVFDKKLSGPLYNLKNVTFVSNPSYVNVHSNRDFEGFDVLLYHGSSFPYYADGVGSIRHAGGLNRVDLIMHYLLKRRHLAPAHNSSLYLPDSTSDFLVIDKVPDFFITGHIHKVCVSNYKNVSCINASCWVTQTEDQERRGIIPEPARVVVINLKDRKARIMNFENEE